jgi:pimeloyl-ACP methyl ester carboxylesterase
MANRFDSEALAARVTCPTLLLHGTEDEIVPVRHADTLAAAFPTPPRVIRTVGATHNDAILLDDEVWPVVAGWARGAP